MTLFGGIFYAISIVLVVSTGLAVTRRNMVHAVVYLVISFCATALLFYLLGSPFLAALEVIIYAGGIMVLFLFIVVMLRLEESKSAVSFKRRWAVPIVLGLVSLVAAGALIFAQQGANVGLEAAMASPEEFGHFLMKEYWFPVEVVSYLLFVGLVGAYYLGKQERKSEESHQERVT
jgi:NADH-quinone oxidoreductase subunit J